jgi:hypothetical protein
VTIICCGSTSSRWGCWAPNSLLEDGFASAGEAPVSAREIRLNDSSSPIALGSGEGSGLLKGLFAGHLFGPKATARNVFKIKLP